MRLLLATLLVIHGIAHLPGFVVAWKLAALPELPYTTTVLAHRVDVGAVGTRVLGVGWLLVALTCVAMAAAVWTDAVQWRSLLPPTVVASVLLCALAWPEARIGLLANAVIIALMWRLR